MLRHVFIDFFLSVLQSFDSLAIFHPNIFIASLIFFFLLICGFFFLILLRTVKILAYLVQIALREDAKRKTKSILQSNIKKYIHQHPQFLWFGRKLVIFIDKLPKIKKQIDISLDLFYTFLVENKQVILTILLTSMILSRIGTGYFNNSGAVIAPEKLFQGNRVGSDLRVGVVEAAVHMMQGKSFYSFYENYGPAFSVSISPLLLLLDKYGICGMQTKINCTPILYKFITLTMLGGYVIFIFLIVGKQKNQLVFLLTFFITFLLGVQGSMGIERGNIDHIFSLFFGLLILLVIRFQLGQKNTFTQAFFSAIVGIIGGFITNTKLFLFPIALVALYGARYMIVGILFFFFSFFIFTYLPKFFGAPSELLGPVINSLSVLDKFPFASASYMAYNHSLLAIATIGTDCVARQTCDVPISVVLQISFVSKILFFIVFIFSIATEAPLIIKMFKFARTIVQKKGIKSIHWIVSLRFNKHLLLFLFVIGVAALNTLPKLALSYRLYFSLPITFLLFLATDNNKKAHAFCILAIIFLLMKGLWIFTDINGHGTTFLEPRGMSFFVIAHYFCLIKSSVHNLMYNLLLHVQNKKLQKIL